MNTISWLNFKPKSWQTENINKDTSKAINKEIFLKQLHTGNSIELEPDKFQEALAICIEVFGERNIETPLSDPRSRLINIGGFHKIGKIRQKGRI